MTGIFIATEETMAMYNVMVRAVVYVRLDIIICKQNVIGLPITMVLF